METTNLYSLEDRYNSILEKDKTKDEDLERRSLFYILAGNLDLYSKIDELYDFQNRNIKIKCFEDEKVDLSNSAYNLIIIALNLYNGYDDLPSDIFSLLSNLDDDNFNIVIQALRIRFNKERKEDGGHSILE